MRCRRRRLFYVGGGRLLLLIIFAIWSGLERKGRSRAEPDVRSIDFLEGLAQGDSPVLHSTRIPVQTPAYTTGPYAFVVAPQERFFELSAVSAPIQADPYGNSLQPPPFKTVKTSPGFVRVVLASFYPVGNPSLSRAC